MKVTPQEYNHTTLMSALTLENKVDSYFYYDLARFTIETTADLIARNLWPTLTFPSCARPLMTNEQINERK